MKALNITLLVIWSGSLAFTLIACDSGSRPSATFTKQKPEPKPAVGEKPAAPSPWRISRSWNEVTGEETVTAVTGYGEQEFVIRQIGKKLECYLITGQFLETVENLHSNRSVAKYKFDDGPIVHEPWGMSADNEGLFCPGNPSTFLDKMRRAKHFAIEYKPADVVSQTVSFDVSEFPAEFSSNKSEGKPASGHKTAAVPIAKLAGGPATDPHVGMTYNEILRQREDKKHQDLAQMKDVQAAWAERCMPSAAQPETNWPKECAELARHCRAWVGLPEVNWPMECPPQLRAILTR
jgi:hypothetical protein